MILMCLGALCAFIGAWIIYYNQKSDIEYDFILTLIGVFLCVLSGMLIVY